MLTVIDEHEDFLSSLKSKEFQCKKILLLKTSFYHSMMFPPSPVVEEKNQLTHKLTKETSPKFKMGEANIRAQTARFCVGKLIKKVKCLDQELVEARHNNAATPVFMKSFKTLLTQKRKAWEPMVKGKRAKRIIQKIAYESLLDNDGDVVSHWRHGPSKKIAITPKKKTQMQSKVKTKSKVQRTTKFGVWRSLGFVWESKIPLKNISTINKIGRHKIALAGIDKINELIQSLSVKRIIKLDRFEACGLLGVSLRNDITKKDSTS